VRSDFDSKIMRTVHKDMKVSVNGKYDILFRQLYCGVENNVCVGGGIKERNFLRARREGKKRVKREFFDEILLYSKFKFFNKFTKAQVALPVK